MQKITVKAAEGASYAILGRIAAGVFQVATSFATARYLSPSDFGVVAFALVYINFFAQFSDFGISTAVVQKRDMSTESFSVALTMKTVVGTILFVIGVVVGLAIAYLGAPASGYLVCFLSITFIVSTLTFVPQTRLTMELDYKRLFWVSLASTIVSFVVTFVLLMAGWRYWAIGVAYLSSVITASAILNTIKRRPYRFSWNPSIGYPLVQFGLPVFLTATVSFLVTYTANLVIGILRGPDDLGLYALAFTLSFMLVNQVGSISAALFPLYSRNREDLSAVRAMFLSNVEYVSVLSVVVNVGLICLAEPLFFNILGDSSSKWLPALKTFYILSANGILCAMMSPIAPLIVAIGRPGVQLRAVAIAALLQGLLIVPALYHFGIEGAASLFTFSSLIQLVIYLPILRHQANVTPVDILRRVAPAMVAGVAMLIASSALLTPGAEYAPTAKALFSMAAQATFLSCVFLIAHGLLTRWRLIQQIRRVAKDAGAASWF